MSLCITCLTFPITIFSLYFKNKDRRGLRPLMLYIPGGLMMCQYVVLGAISDHVPSQAYLKDSIRLYNFTFYEQILGIIVTIVANLWNASVDTTILKYIKSKGWLEHSDRSWWSKILAICCRPEDDTDQEDDPDPEELHDRITVKPNFPRTKTRAWKSADNQHDT